MKTKIIILTSLISVGLLTGTTALARGGNGSVGGNRGIGAGSPLRDGSGPAANPNRGNPGSPGTPVKDGSGKSVDRGNPNGNGTPLKDGSGKSTAPGRGAKDGTGNQANCPVPPKG